MRERSPTAAELTAAIWDTLLGVFPPKAFEKEPSEQSLGRLIRLD